MLPIVFITLVIGSTLQSQPNIGFSGTWSLDREKSEIPPGGRGLGVTDTLVITRTDTALLIEQQAIGAEYIAHYLAAMVATSPAIKGDGTGQAATRSSFERSSAHSRLASDAGNVSK